jgi:hypothetical protein
VAVTQRHCLVATGDPRWSSHVLYQKRLRQKKQRLSRQLIAAK